MIKMIVAGVAGVVIIGVIALKSDLACQYSPVDISWINACEGKPAPLAVVSVDVENTNIEMNDADVTQSNKNAEIKTKVDPIEPLEADKNKAILDVKNEMLSNIAPSIDIARVEADGSTLVAGRSMPLSKVTLKNANKVIGETVANDTGEWVIIPDNPIVSDNATLSLVAMMPDGKILEANSELIISLKDSNVENETPPIEPVKPVVLLADNAIKSANNNITPETAVNDVAKPITTDKMPNETAKAKMAETAKTQMAEAAKTKMAKTKMAKTQMAETAKTQMAKKTAMAAQKMNQQSDVPSIVKKVEKLVEPVAKIANSEAIPNLEKQQMQKPAMQTMKAPITAKVTDKAAILDAGVKQDIATAMVDSVKSNNSDVKATTTIMNDAKTGKTDVMALKKTMPEKTAKAKEILVVLREKDKGSRVLQGAGVGQKNNQMTFNSLDFNTNGEVIFSGDAKANAIVRVYVNNQFVGEAIADINGRWSLNKSYIMMAGNNQMRFDQVDAAGVVISRRETKITMPKMNQEAALAAKAANAKSAAMLKADNGEKTMKNMAIKPENIMANAKALNHDAVNNTNIEVGERIAKVAKHNGNDNGNGNGNVKENNNNNNQMAIAINNSDDKTLGNMQAADKKVTPKADAEITTANIEVDMDISNSEKSTKVTTATAVDDRQSNIKDAVANPKKVKAIIIWGDNLWNISRKIYGKGELYTTIFKANSKQIRDPNLIYPGQVFILPENTEIK